MHRLPPAGRDGARRLHRRRRGLAAQERHRQRGRGPYHAALDARPELRLLRWRPVTHGCRAGAGGRLGCGRRTERARPGPARPLAERSRGLPAHPRRADRPDGLPPHRPGLCHRDAHPRRGLQALAPRTGPPPGALRSSCRPGRRHARGRRGCLQLRQHEHGAGCRRHPDGAALPAAGRRRSARPRRLPAPAAGALQHRGAASGRAHPCHHLCARPLDRRRGHGAAAQHLSRQRR